MVTPVCSYLPSLTPSPPFSLSLVQATSISLSPWTPPESPHCPLCPPSCCLQPIVHIAVGVDFLKKGIKVYISPESEPPVHSHCNWNGFQSLLGPLSSSPGDLSIRPSLPAPPRTVLWPRQAFSLYLQPAQAPSPACASAWNALSSDPCMAASFPHQVLM